MEQRGVDMVRLEKAEEVYDVEEVLGRDASSVFPSLQAQLDPMEQLKAAVGAKRFVTEAELEEIKAARGLRADDGTAAVDKPLAEVLAERKKAKQDAFDDTWKQMKTGKNRPLDADELEFYDSLAQQEAEQHRRMRQEEDEELAAFRQAVAAAAEAKAAAAEAKAAAAADDGLEGAAAAAGPGPGSGGMAELGRSSSGASAGKPAAVRLYSKPALPVLKPIVKAKPKGAAAAGGGQQGSSSSGGTQQPKTAAAAAGGGASPHSKRQRLEHAAAGQQPQQQQGAGAGLAGLLGGYGSGSDDADA